MLLKSGQRAESSSTFIFNILFSADVRTEVWLLEFTSQQKRIDCWQKLKPQKTENRLRKVRSHREKHIPKTSELFFPTYNDGYKAAFTRASEISQHVTTTFQFPLPSYFKMLFMKLQVNLFSTDITNIKCHENVIIYGSVKS
ncbi:hypothetical protein PAMP_024035 [Pampus punctatissimus]